MNGPPPPILTRRAMLRGVAAASMLSPATGLAAALDRKRPWFSSWIGSLNGGLVQIRPRRPFELVGIEWRGVRASSRIELRSWAREGGWSPWGLASVLGHGPDRAVHRGAAFGEPIWTGPAELVQLRSSEQIRGLRLHFVAADATVSARTARALPQARPVLDAGPGQPSIIARAGWAQGQAPPAVPPEYGKVRLAFVHHTESPNGYSAADVPAMLMSIYVYHRYVRGWDDIGYNFAIDAFGRIWEARAGGIDEAVIGAQAGGYNGVSTGVAVLGSFMTVPPPRASIHALEHLLAWKLALHGIPAAGRVTVKVNPADAFYTPFAPGARVSLPRVAGHRDGDATNCPGDAFYARLPAIRPRVVALAGTPARLTLHRPRAAATAGTPAVASGRLALLDGRPVPGAPIEVQRLGSRGPRTIATASTAPDGSWSVPLALRRSARVRALHRPAPAAVSQLVTVSVLR